MAHLAFNIKLQGILKGKTKLNTHIEEKMPSLDPGLNMTQTSELSDMELKIAITIR